MKVAVVTLHRVYNYGSVLQAYATQQVLEKLGHEVRIVDYITEQRTKWRLLCSPSQKEHSRGMGTLAYRIARFFSICIKELTFGTFVRKRLHLTSKYISVEDLAKNPPEADVYITGSDQTWNSDYNEGVDRGFFLDFIPKEAKRIAFAASFGKTEIDEQEAETIRELIKPYSAISVRESSALEILARIDRTDAIQLVDPTLLIKKEEWMTLASKRLVKEPYLVLMLLYNEDNHATEYAREIADEKGLKLVKISWEHRKPRQVDKLFTHRTPSDFLSLLWYADFVVTNSFHGLAFSINFEKQFLVVPREEYNSRLASLLQMLGLTNRMVSSKESLRCVSQEIQYEQVRKTLANERNKAFDFLRNSLME